MGGAAWDIYVRGTVRTFEDPRYFLCQGAGKVNTARLRKRLIMQSIYTMPVIHVFGILIGVLHGGK